MRELEIVINRNSKVKYYYQLYYSFIDGINEGKLKANFKIPSVRLLAEELNISRNTVIKAYSMLEKEHYIYSKYKSGYYVSQKDAAGNFIIPETSDDEMFVPTVEDIFKSNEIPAESGNFDLDLSVTATVSMEEDKYLQTDFSSSDDFINPVAKKIAGCYLSVLRNQFDKLLKKGNSFGEDSLRSAIYEHLLRTFNEVLQISDSNFSNIYSSSDQIIIAATRDILIENISELDSVKDKEDSWHWIFLNSNEQKTDSTINEKTICISDFQKELGISLEISFALLPKKLCYDYTQEYKSTTCSADKITQLMLAKFLSQKSRFQSS